MVNEALHIYLDDLFLTCDVTRFLLDSGHDSPISIAIQVGDLGLSPPIYIGI